MPTHNLPRPVHTCNCGDHAWTVLTRGYATMVSVEDAHFLQERAWCAEVAGRKVYAVSGREYFKLHRVVLQNETEMLCDHKNGNGLDNRRDNLRLATDRQNSQNMRKARNKTSQFKGVCWDKQRNKWESKIRVDGIRQRLGFFSDEVEAACAYDTAAIKHFKEFAWLNFPQG